MDAHSRHIEETYNITAEEYWQLYHFQGGVCAICQRATGKRKRLSLDHDHACCSGSTSCGSCCRGLCCKVCNSMLGHFRDDTETLSRAIDYLNNPPFKRMKEQQ